MGLEDPAGSILRNLRRPCKSSRRDLSGVPVTAKENLRGIKEAVSDARETYSRE